MRPTFPSPICRRVRFVARYCRTWRVLPSKTAILTGRGRDSRVQVARDLTTSRENSLSDASDAIRMTYRSGVTARSPSEFSREAVRPSHLCTRTVAPTARRNFGHRRKSTRTAISTQLGLRPDRQVGLTCAIFASANSQSRKSLRDSWRPASRRRWRSGVRGDRLLAVRFATLAGAARSSAHGVASCSFLGSEIDCRPEDL